jgi:hypothetical protein
MTNATPSTAARPVNLIIDVVAASATAAISQPRERMRR